MKMKVMVLLLLSLFSYILLNRRSEESAVTEWKRVKTRKEITVHTRWSEKINNNQFKEIKAETRIDIPMDKLLGMIQTGIYTNEWMSMVGNYYVTEGLDKNQWDSQITYKLPWPLAKNDLSMCYQLLYKSPDSTIISFNSRNASLYNWRIKPGVYKFKGSWELTSIGGEATQVNLTIKWDKRNALPSWLSAPFITDGLWYSLRKLKRLSEEKYKVPLKKLAVTAL